MVMSRIRLDDLVYLTDKEKIGIRKVYDYNIKMGMFVRLILIGSKARGDYKSDSDVDIIALYEDAAIDNGMQVIDFVETLNINENLNISYMLFPEDIEYDSEEYGVYDWITEAITKDGIRIKMK